jgi:hypothetical protein
MFNRIFGFLALAFSLFGTQSWAATCFFDGAGVPFCTNTFSPAAGGNTNTYDFSGTGDGRLVVAFDTVLTTFTLTVTVNHHIDPLDPNEFPTSPPPGTVCVKYEFNGSQCDEYDFSGNPAVTTGPNGVPVKNKDYKGLITLTLSYFTSQTINTPAFGHAPETNDTTMYNEDILTGYFTPSPSPSRSPSLSPSPSDPTMDGMLPGLSSVVALDKPLTENDTYCWVFPESDGQQYFVGQTIEVSFQLFASPPCSGNTGTPIRDKTASLSLSNADPTAANPFPPRLQKEEGNKFHWDNANGRNEFDLSTEGLQPGTYTITVISSKFSPQSRDITLAPSSSMVCLPLSSGVSCF